MRVARPVLQPMIGMPLPSDEIYASLKDLLLDLGGMRKVLTDPGMTTVRIVLNLEKMVVKEAQRAFTYLSLYDYLTDLIVVNRVLPPEVQDTYFDSWRQTQQRYAELVERSFSPVPIVQTRLFDHEMVGVANLKEMADSIYGGDDPTTIYYRAVPQRLQKVNGGYELHLQLPFVSKEDVDITHREGELYVTVGPYKREISLPRVLNGKKVTRGRLDDGMLSVTFADARK
jgi:arsenite-transporting ATPase